MATTNISNNPLAVYLKYYVTDQQTTKTLAEVEAIFPAIGLLLGPLQPFIAPGATLGGYFDGLWTHGLQATFQSKSQAQFVQQAAAQGYSVTQVNAVAPSSGALLAEATSNLPSDGGPGGFGVLTLTYRLQGCDISFDTGSVTAEWDVSYDTDLQFESKVPILPFSLAFTGNAVPSNANLNSDNFVAWAEGAVLNLANLLSFGLIPTPYDGVPGAVDGAAEPFVAPQINNLADALNPLGPEVVSYGFTQCEFSIVNGDALALTLLHPLDPAPTPLINLLDPGPGSVLSNPPQLTASVGEVKPGGSLVASGSGFPVATAATQALIAWRNTSSGPANGAQLRYGVGASESQTIPVPLAGHFAAGGYTYLVSGLSPGVTYEFQARCQDALSWSRWSEPLSVTTLPTTIVDLALQPSSGGAGVIIASAALSASDGQWSSPATIPSNTGDGVYNLVAQLASVPIASTQIIVASVLTPLLLIKTAPPFVGGLMLTLQGESFPDQQVTINVPGESSVLAQPSNGQFEVQIAIPGNADSPAASYTVSASVGGEVVAQLVVQTLGPPQ